MIKLFSSLLFLFLISCSNLKTGQVEIKEDASLEKLETLNFVMVPGETKYISLQLPFTDKSYELFCDNKKITASFQSNHLRAFIAIPYKYEKELFLCELKEHQKIAGMIVSVKVKKIKYKTSYINVAKRKVDLKPSDIEWYLEDKKELKNAYANIDLENIYFSRPFKTPLNSKVTSPYGAKRIFNNKKSSWHNGIDFRAKVGTPIPSTNRGKVILVRHLFFNGKTVLVDHGMNIVSLYCHLSAYNVKVGDIINQGEIVGFGGNTGRSSGPHLHWGMRVQEYWINGFSLVNQSKKHSFIKVGSSHQNSRGNAL